MGSERRPAGRLFCENPGRTTVRPYAATGHVCLTRWEPGARSVGAELARPNVATRRMRRHPSGPTEVGPHTATTG